MVKKVHRKNKQSFLFFKFMKGNSDREFLVLLFLFILIGVSAVAGLAGRDIAQTFQNPVQSQPPAEQEGDLSNETINVTLTFDKGVYWTPLKKWQTQGVEGGLNWRGIESDLKSMVDSNITWVRLSPSSDSKTNDRLFSLINQYKIRPVVVITGSPSDTAGNFFQRLTYRNSVQQLAESQKSRVQFFEIGSEPNNPTYWKVPETTDNSGAYEAAVVDYIERLKDSYDAIKKTNPKAYVILGGLSDHNTTYWLDVFMNKQGYNYIDITAYHPAGKTPADIVNKTNAIRAYTTNVPEFGTKPFWVTAFGFTTTKKDNEAYYVQDEKTKAEYLTTVFTELRRSRIYGPIFWYMFAEAPETKAGYGLILKNHTNMKTTYLPAFEAMKELQ